VDDEGRGMRGRIQNTEDRRHNTGDRRERRNDRTMEWWSDGRVHGIKSEARNSKSETIPKRQFSKSETNHK
jgi:hypothetical protein